MAGNRSKNLPSFRSVDELVAFIETHDIRRIKLRIIEEKSKLLFNWFLNDLVQRHSDPS